MTVLTVEFGMAFLRIKPNNIIAILFLFLQDFIQLCDSRIRDLCEMICFRVQFNFELPLQVIQFSYKIMDFLLTIGTRGIWSHLGCSGSRVGLHAKKFDVLK